MTVTRFQQRLAQALAAQDAGASSNDPYNTDLQRMLPSGDFIKDYTPPDYLIDGLIQKRCLYSYTSPTGGGKTATLLCTAAHIAMGLKIGFREVVKSKVLFLAGENPDDIRARWIKQCEDMSLEPGQVNDVVFLPAVMNMSLPDVRAHIDRQANANGPFGLIIVDTSAAYFFGDDENSNAQAGSHARTLRSLTNLPGGPAVIVATHPTKNPNIDNLLPRGGGSYVAEVDGNLVGILTGAVVKMHWHGKFRGPDFEPLYFKLMSGHTDKLVDSKGRQIMTVTAMPISQTEAADLKDQSEEKENRLLALMKARPGLSMRQMASLLEWVAGDNKPNVSQVQRSMEKLETKGFAEKQMEKWVVTGKGKSRAGVWANQADLGI